MKQKHVIVSLVIALLFVLNGCDNQNTETAVTSSGTTASTTISDTTVASDTREETTANPSDESRDTDVVTGEMTLEDELEQFYQGGLQHDQPIFETAQRLYPVEELREMSDLALAVCRNEIYARHGRIFQAQAWNTFFSQFSWYEGLYTAEQFFEQELFSQLEKDNLKQILSVESERKETAVFTLKSYPRVDGSTATIPLSEQFAADAMGLSLEEASLYILHTKTHNAYVNLMEGKADIIFVTYPSEEELQLAEEAGVELEIYPVVKEAFVFLVNEKNPITDLSHQQILDIYTGKMKNWSEAGGEDQEIMAYQRPINSGSQSGMLSLVMKDTPIMEAPSHYYYGEMDGLVEAVSSYDNAEYAIGYSYYYYVSSMYFRKGVRLLSIDGVAPETATIQNGSYPYTTAYYAVIKSSEPKDSGSRKLLTWIEQKGKQSAEMAGYVPLQ